VAQFQLITRDASPQTYNGARLATVTVRLVVSKTAGSVWFTDIFLQGGAVATGWVGNVCEMKWTLDG
jgi:hypothetical protein